MKTLTRPMFNMGGPIKQGVMHGIREPYKHGQRVMPTSDGSRPGYAGPLVLAAPAAWTAARAAAMRLAPRAFRGIKSLFGKTGPVTKTVPKQGPPFTIPSGRTLSSKGYPGGQIPGRTIGPGTTEVTQQVFKPNPMTRYLAASPEGKIAKWVWDGKGWVAKAVAMPFKSPLTAGYLIYEGGKWLRKDGSEATDGEIAAFTKGPPGGGDPNMKGSGAGGLGGTEDTAANRAAFAKSQRDARVQKYMDMMGYDRSKKTALADALIDASKIVSERGSLDPTNITGELINPIIQATSKRLDKPEQIREAVGLMMTKAGLEKEMYEAKSKLTDELTKKRIQVEDAKLTKDSLFGDVAQIAEKQGSFPTGENLAMYARNRGIPIDGIVAAKDIAKWKKENKGQTDVDYITEVAKLKETTPGTYVVNDNIFVVNEDKTITRRL